MKKSENRKKERVPVIAAAFVVNPKQRNSPIEAHIVNISYGGVGLYVKEPLEGRVQVAISLGVEEDTHIAEIVSGHVCWNRRLIGSSWVVGISFEGLNPKEHGRLLSYLDRHIK